MQLIFLVLSATASTYAPTGCLRARCTVAASATMRAVAPAQLFQCARVSCGAGLSVERRRHPGGLEQHQGERVLQHRRPHCRPRSQVPVPSFFQPSWALTLWCFAACAAIANDTDARLEQGDITRISQLMSRRCQILKCGALRCVTRARGPPASSPADPVVLNLF